MLEDRERFAREQRERHAASSAAAQGGLAATPFGAMRAATDDDDSDADGAAPPPQHLHASKRRKGSGGAHAPYRRPSHRSDRQWDQRRASDVAGLRTLLQAKELEVGQLERSIQRLGAESAPPDRGLPPPPGAPPTAAHRDDNRAQLLRLQQAYVSASSQRSALRAQYRELAGREYPSSHGSLTDKSGSEGEGGPSPTSAGAARARRPSRDDSDFDDASARGRGRSSLTAYSKVRSKLRRKHKSKGGESDDGANSEAMSPLGVPSPPGIMPPPALPPPRMSHADLDRVTMRQLDRSRSGSSRFIEASKDDGAASIYGSAPAPPPALALRGLSCMILAVLCFAMLLFGEMLLHNVRVPPVSARASRAICSRCVARAPTQITDRLFGSPEAGTLPVFEGTPLAEQSAEVPEYVPEPPVAETGA